MREAVMWSTVSLVTCCVLAGCSVWPPATCVTETEVSYNVIMWCNVKWSSKLWTWPDPDMYIYLLHPLIFPLLWPWAGPLTWLLDWNLNWGKRNPKWEMHKIDLLLRRIFHVFECSTKVWHIEIHPGSFQNWKMLTQTFLLRGYHF